MSTNQSLKELIKQMEVSMSEDNVSPLTKIDNLSNIRAVQKINNQFVIPHPIITKQKSPKITNTKHNVRKFSIRYQIQTIKQNPKFQKFCHFISHHKLLTLCCLELLVLLMSYALGTMTALQNVPSSITSSPRAIKQYFNMNFTGSVDVKTVLYFGIYNVIGIIAFVIGKIFRFKHQNNQKHVHKNPKYLAPKQLN